MWSGGPVHNSNSFEAAGHQVCDLFRPVHGFKSNFNIQSSAIFLDFLDILQMKHLHNWYIDDLEVNGFPTLPNMTGFKITELSGHMGTVGHTWALGNLQEHWDTDGALVHGVCIQIMKMRRKLQQYYLLSLSCSQKLHIGNTSIYISQQGLCSDWQMTPIWMVLEVSRFFLENRQTDWPSPWSSS